MWNAIKEVFTDFAELFYKHYLCGALLLTAIYVGLDIELFYLYRGELFYIDTDCYTRALRIVDWLQDFQWQEKLFPYFNPAGSGFELHFTRICDVIWLLFTLPFMPFMELKDAVFYGGMFFSPLFMALSLASVLWGLKPYLPPLKNSNGVFLIMALILLFLFNKTTSCFDFSRPDHHSLMCFVYCFGMAVVLRSHITPNYRELFFSGLVCGLGMWASSALEGLFVVAIILIALSFNHIFYARKINELISFCFGLFLSVTIAWLINPPLNGYMALNINRLSVIHVVLTALMLLSFLIISRINVKNKIVQILCFGGATVLSAATLILIFGIDNLLVPVYDPLVYDVFVPRVIEMKAIAHYSYRTPIVLFGLIIAEGLILAQYKKTELTWNLVFFIAVSCLAANICQRFWPYYIGALTLSFGMAGLIMVQTAQINKKFYILLIAYILSPLIYCSFFSPFPAYDSYPKMEGIVLTDVFYAPRISYKSGTDTVGGPYHSDIEGITDNYNMWFTTDEEELKKLIKKHQVKTVFIDCNVMFFYENPAENTDKLYGKVITGKDIYPWLDKIEGCRYQVNYDKL